MNYTSIANTIVHQSYFEPTIVILYTNLQQAFRLHLSTIIS